MQTATVINNETTVANFYEAFVRGDIPYITSRVANDCKWIAAGGGLLPHGGNYSGMDTILFFNSLAENLDFQAFNPLSINAISENEVAAFGNMTVASRATGKKVISDWAMNWKFNEEGLVVYYHDYYDTASVYLAYQKPLN